jgi:hypothetical protein
MISTTDRREDPRGKKGSIVAAVDDKLQFGSDIL